MLPWAGAYDVRVTADDKQRACAILHVDMDAFFVAVELLDRPELKGRPVIVGAVSGRSVVLSASYEARRFGVRSAMPMATARRLCPGAVVLGPRQDAYREMSGAVMDLFRTITPQVEPLSVDEAFLDVSGSVRRLGQPSEIGALIRRRVAEELGITASVGIAGTKFVAKIASTRAKPDGLLVIRPEETVAYLHALPVEALWGVGEKTRTVLARAGIRTIADVAHTPESALRRLLGVTGEHVHRLAWGVDERRVTPERVEKSIGAEETFAQDTSGDDVLLRELLRLAHRTAGRLRSAGKMCRSVSLKVRYADFSTLTRSRTFSEPVDGAQPIYAAVKGLLQSLGERPMSVRLVGIRAEHLEDALRVGQQLSLDPRDGNWRRLEETLDRVHGRFGAGGLVPARLLPPERGDREGRTSDPKNKDPDRPPELSTDDDANYS